jgi:hypothetical protein
VLEGVRRLGLDLPPLEPTDLLDDPVRPDRPQQVDRRHACPVRANIGEIDDHPLPDPLDRRMRRLDETPEPIALPVVAARR